MASPDTQALIERLSGTAPTIRPLPLRKSSGVAFTAGRDARGRYAPEPLQVRVRVTARGHWYRSDDEPDELHNDRLCRGCGHHGHFDYILDYQECGRPATAADVISALLRRSAVAA